jgi:hypothetical protein
MIARAAGVHSALDAKAANDGGGETPTFDYTFDIPVEVAAAVCKYRHDRWKIEWGKPQFTWLDVAIGSKSEVSGCNREVRCAPVNRHRQDDPARPKSAKRRHAS